MSNLDIPKKVNFDVTVARKKCEFPISVFRILGYNLDFNSTGDIIFTNDGSHSYWYIRAYTGNSIVIKDGNKEIYFALDKTTYHVDFTIKGIFEFSEGMRAELSSVFDNAVCTIDVNNLN